MNSDDGIFMTLEYEALVLLSMIFIWKMSWNDDQQWLFWSHLFRRRFPKASRRANIFLLDNRWLQKLLNLKHKNLLYPFPPKIWTASRQICVAFSAQYKLSPAQSWFVGSFLSACLATLYKNDRQADKEVYMSAILPWTSWNSPIRWLNCFRSWA